MDLHEAIYLRRTVRDFEDKEVNTDIIKKIIDAGLQAPSNNHMREWEFIVINDKSERMRIIEKIKKNRTQKDALDVINSWGLMDEYQREMYIEAIPRQYQMLLSAGILIIPCFRQIPPLLQPDSLSALNPFASIWCCIENILLAAVNEGIYGVTRIPFDEEIAHIKETSKIPQGYEIPCYIALGYPKGDVKFISQHSINVEERIHFNRWDANLEKMI